MNPINFTSLKIQNIESRDTLARFAFNNPNSFIPMKECITEIDRQSGNCDVFLSADVLKEEQGDILKLEAKNNRSLEKTVTYIPSAKDEYGKAFCEFTKMVIEGITKPEKSAFKQSVKSFLNKFLG